MRRRSVIGSCPRVGLQPPASTTNNGKISNRTKQMFALSLGKERASSVLKELNFKEPRKAVRDVPDNVSDVSSFTASERNLLSLPPKESPLKVAELPQLPKEEYVAKWIPVKIVAAARSVFTPPRSLKRSLVAYTPSSATDSNAQTSPQRVTCVKKVLELDRPLAVVPGCSSNPVENKSQCMDLESPDENLTNAPSSVQPIINVAPSVELLPHTRTNCDTKKSQRNDTTNPDKSPAIIGPSVFSIDSTPKVLLGSKSKSDIKESQHTNGGNDVYPNSRLSHSSPLTDTVPDEESSGSSPSDGEDSAVVSSYYAMMRQKSLQENDSILAGLLGKNPSPSSAVKVSQPSRRRLKFPIGKKAAAKRQAQKRKAAPTLLKESSSETENDTSEVDEAESEEVTFQSECDDSDDEHAAPEKHTSFPKSGASSKSAPSAKSTTSSQHVARPQHEECSSDSDSSEFDSGLVFQRECDDSDLDKVEETPKRISSRQLKQERKYKRNIGQSYETSKGKIISERKRKAVHECKRLRCQDIITDDIGETLFREYWEMGSYELRVQYVAARVLTAPIERSRKRDEDSERSKSVTHSYYFEIGGKRQKVCKDTFLKTIAETDTFVRHVMKKKSMQVSGITRPDRRGRHVPKHKMKDDVKNAVLAHINSFPHYESHYSRKQNSQKYLPSQLDLSVMHRLYLESDNPKVSYSSYFRIFKPLKLKFQPLLSDTCSKCDTLDTKIKFAHGDEQKKLEQEKEFHLRKAEKAYSLKIEMKKKVSNNEKQRVLVFDLEQCLPSPALNCGTIYYKRQLYTFNLTICDTKTKRTHCYMWHEAEGNRGANEIASCIYDHIKNEIPHGVEELFLFSDCCSGQNRNSIVCSMFQVALQVHPTLKKINHIFLIPGHTRMECDSKHSTIERAKKKELVINVPSDYYRMVEEAGKADLINFPEGKFQVVLMAPKIYNFGILMKYPNSLIKRNKTVDKAEFKYLKTHWFQYQRNQPGLVMVKSAFGVDVPFQTVSFRRAKKASLPDLSSMLEKAYEGPLPISVKKKKDLMDLLCFLDPCHHAFYQNLTTNKTLIDTHPDCPSDNESDDDDLDE